MRKVAEAQRRGAAGMGGRTIETTLTHPFLTMDGWKPLGEVSAGDHVAVPRLWMRTCSEAFLHALLDLINQRSSEWISSVHAG